ncbi:hypothetical protein SAMN05421666_1298 [Roseovarius nanhaiticus]|uniref:Uncharacterized protein n=1 Tax=Roseovarius nanhaiticus TaxID=573024 RepID=A0A1N7FRB8_9RHOB|nr:hypothetical protein SAMN05216208_0838 [Roseovarius nanhaiticus]SIS02889.1 hypothetical protein SAMN05421666_1298 [Roseovarius nanhaiticus]
MAERDTSRASIVAGRNAPSVVQPARNDLDPVAVSVAVPIGFRRYVSLFYGQGCRRVAFWPSTPLVSICVISAISGHPCHIRQSAHWRAGTDVFADRICGHGQVSRASLAVADGVQLGVHAALGSANQASAISRLTLRLVAVRWAFQVGVHRHRLFRNVFGNQTDRYPHQDALAARTFPTAIGHLM